VDQARQLHQHVAAMFRRYGTRGRGRSLRFGDRLINLCLAHKQYLRLWLPRHRMKMTIGSSGEFGIFS